MMMKMAAVSTITLFLLCCSFASTDGCHYAATGGNFTVNLTHQLTSDNRLKWMHDSKVIVQRRQNNVFVEGTKENIYENGSLKLTNLQKSDAGKYYPEVHDSDGKQIQNLKGIQLCVLDPVPKPRVTLKCSPSVSLTCNFGQADNPNIQWFQNNKVLTKKNNPTLTLEDKKMHKDSFHCEVSNAISSFKSTTIDNLCFVSPKSFPDEVFGINTWIFVGGGGGVVLLLIILVIVCCIQTRRKKRLQLKDEGELRLAWTSDQQHQHQHQHNHPPDQQHHHHHHHQQQPAGHTGPRQHRSKQHHNQQRHRAPNPSHPQPSPRRPAQAPPIPVDNDDEQPPPLPQPRKKAPKSPRV